MRSLPVLSGALRLSRRPLLRPGQLLLPLTRAQVSSVATAQAADGTSWTEFPLADTPRFSGAARRLAIGGQRTNGFANPRCEGAVPGTPGTMPTFWTIATALGLTTSVVGAGAEDGIPFFDLRFAGTPTSSGNLQVNHTAPAASDGQIWTYSLFSKLVAGSPPGSAALALQVGSASANTTYTLSSGALGASRRSATATGAGGASSSLARWRMTGITSGSPVDFTVRLGAVQNEQGAFASMPIFPPVGTPGASTRGADLVAPTLASLGIPASGDCTLLFDLVIPQAAPTGVNQTLLVVDDSTANNRLALQNPGGGATIVPSRVTGGSGASGSSAGTFTPGTPFRVAASIRAGRIAASVAGGAVVAATGGPTSGLTHLRIGNDLVGTAALFGELGSIDLLPAVPDGVLRALSAGAL